MGIVHAKDGGVLDAHRKQSLNLEHIPAKVRRVYVDGLRRTKDDLAAQEVKDVLNAENFQDMVLRANRAKCRLERLGIFASVAISIDTNKECDAPADGYDVTFEVNELKNIIGGVTTLLGTNDASLMLNLRSPNVFGRAEKFCAEYTHGTTHNSGFSVSVTKPFERNPDTRILMRAFQNATDCPWSSYRELNRGLSADLTFNTYLGQHEVRWYGVWRELNALSNTTSFAVREQLGHSLLSSVRHTCTRDYRDNPVMPNRGTFIRLTQEYAGLGGDAEFLKHELEFQYNKPLVLDSVVQLSLASGLMKSLNPQRPIRISDRFFLGGPLTLRGFALRGAGEHSDGDALGGESYWLAGAHLYTPLPFRPGRGGFGDLFRTHFFINAGSLGTLNFNDTVRQNALSAYHSLRLAYGAGLAMKFAHVARVELNYVVPIRAQPGDKLNSGVQFGIGVAFL